MKLIDISHTLDENTPVFPGDYKTTLSKHNSLESDFFNAYLLQTCLHTGTHIDIPMHLTSDDRPVCDFPIDCFAGNGVLLDVRGQEIIKMTPAYMDIIRERDIVLLFTGHDKLFFNDEYFSKHPIVSGELAEFLVSRKIKILGMDMPAPDYAPYTLHRELLRNGVLVLENLTNLQSLTGVKTFEVFALPLKICAEASFVRAVCRVS